MHGTGYLYPPWVGSAWYPFPATYASWGGPADANRANLYQSYGAGVSSEVRSSFTASPAGVLYSNARNGKPSPYGTVEAANDVYVDKDGHIYSNSTGSWQRHSAEGWSGDAGDTDWADREARARRAGDDAFREFTRATAVPAGAPQPGGNSSR